MAVQVAAGALRGGRRDLLLLGAACVGLSLLGRVGVYGTVWGMAGGGAAAAMSLTCCYYRG